MHEDNRGYGRLFSDARGQQTGSFPLFSISCKCSELWYLQYFSYAWQIKQRVHFTNKASKRHAKVLLANTICRHVKDSKLWDNFKKDIKKLWSSTDVEWCGRGGNNNWVDSMHVTNWRAPSWRHMFTLVYDKKPSNLIFWDMFKLCIHYTHTFAQRKITLVLWRSRKV